MGASLPIQFLKYRLLPLNTSNLLLRARWSTWKMPARAYFLLFEVVKITLLHINSKFPHNFLKHNRSIKHARVLSRFSHVQLCVTLWTVACQAHLSMGFSRQEYWSGLPCLPSGDLSNPGIEDTSLMSPALSGTTSTTWEVPSITPTWN